MKTIVKFSLLLLNVLISQLVFADPPQAGESVNFEQVTFKTSQEDRQDNLLFWNLVTDKPNDLKMENVLRFIRVDLDRDGSMDLLGTLSGNSYYCGHQGAECQLFAVVKGRLIESLCNAPMFDDIKILSSKTNGLRDISWKNGCHLQYDGKSSYGVIH